MDYLLKKNESEILVEIRTRRLNDDIVDQLIMYRKMLKMTQQDIADRTGIKRANIARLESKKHSVTLESLIKYADCLNMDVKIELCPKQHAEIN